MDCEDYYYYDFTIHVRARFMAGNIKQMHQGFITENYTKYVKCFLYFDEIVITNLLHNLTGQLHKKGYRFCFFICLFIRSSLFLYKWLIISPACDSRHMTESFFQVLID